MSGSAIQALLSERVISFNPLLARVANDVKGGLFLSQCCFLSQVHGDKDGWFYSTDKQWFEATFLTRKEILRVRTILEEQGIIEHKVKGQAHKTYYRVNWNQLEKALLVHAKGSTKNAQNDKKAVCENEEVKKCTDLPKGRLQTAERDVCKRPKGTFANSPKGHTKKELREELREDLKNNHSLLDKPVDNFEEMSEARQQYEREKAKLFKQTGTGRKKTGVEAALGG